MPGCDQREQGGSAMNENDTSAGHAASGGAGGVTFADILAPVSPERFFAEYHGRQVLHVPGGVEKFAAAMSWDKLNALLNMTMIWKPQSFEMALDGAILPARDYCRPSLDVASGAGLQPDTARVIALLKEGASLLLNDIDTLNPGLASVACALEETLESRVQANLYCSSRQRQAFPSHFDTHDVYAMHVEGEKLWRIYEGRLDHPVSHPTFKGQPASFHEAAKGKIAAEILLKPGDLLYIPRGTYHDAIAQTDGTVHVAFGAVAVIGLDLVSGLFERAVQDPLFRRDVPRRHAPGGETAFEQHIQALARRLAELAADADTARHFRAFQDAYRYPRGGFALSKALFDSAAYRVASGFSVVRRGEAWVLRKADRATAIPPGLDRMVAWVIARPHFARADFAAAFGKLGDDQRREILQALESMGVIAPAGRP
jgi:ribosomal protein L16 Arg81 hydroxylase